nr:MAG: ADP-ribosyltransferase [Bacteriophage sp.]UVX51483.1 MAG: ADP-ribosyltransferase [Bacteriophage sp.]
MREFRQWSKEEGYYDEDGDFISTKIIPQENDGILVERTNQSDTSKEFVAINSNQIKSVDNQGTFST